MGTPESRGFRRAWPQVCPSFSLGKSSIRGALAPSFIATSSTSSTLCVDHHFVIVGNCEATFFQDPDKCDVVFGSMGIQGPCLYMTQELRKRFGGNAFAPVFSSNLVADISFT